MEPFFSDSLHQVMREPFNQAFRQDTAIDALDEWAEAQPGLQPTAFIYHASRCGSTLLARMLMTLPTHVVVSEPQLLDNVLHAAYWLPTLDAACQIRWVRSLLSALGQPRAGSERHFVVKLNAWNIIDRPLLQNAFPNTPWIFLYRDPLEIGASQLRQPGAHVVPGMLGPATKLFQPEEAAAIPRSEFVARVVGAILEAARAACVATGARPVHYIELPDALWTSLATTFGVAADAAIIAAMQEVARYDAKTPQLLRDPDDVRKQREASVELRAAIERFALPPYQALESLRREFPQSSLAANAANP